MKKQDTAVRRRRFERIVVLVDITVIVQHNCLLCAAHVFNSVWKILQQCDEHSKFSTMWGYKLFDPSFAPLASRSKIGEFLGGTPMSEQFDATSPNLERFGRVLHSLVNTHRQYDSGEGSRAEYIGRAINEIISDYIWDPLLCSDSSSSDEERRKRGSLASNWLGDGVMRDSNTIILISSIPATWEDVTRFVNSPQLVGQNDESAVLGQLTKTFRPVQEALKSRNIQVCFLEVPPKLPLCKDLWSEARLQTLLHTPPPRSLILKGLSLFRSFIPIDLLVVSPTLLPCNLVWNMMADLGVDEPAVKFEGQVLCKGQEDTTTILCEVQVQPFNVLHTPSISRGSPMSTLSLVPGAEKVDIVLGSVLPKSSVAGKVTSERFLVRQSTSPRRPSSGEDNHCHALGDQILQLLQQTSNAFLPGQPTWQVLLLTLACERSVCEVSLFSHEHGHSRMAVLEPFTSQFAILTVVEKEAMQAKTNTCASMRIVGQQPRIDGVSSMIAASKEEPAAAAPVNPAKRSKDGADNSKHVGVTVIRSRKRQRVYKDFGINLTEWDPCYQGDGQQPERITWQEYWERIRTRFISIPCFPPDGGTLLSRYMESGTVSEVLQTMDKFFNEMKQRSISNVSSARLLPECTLAVSEDDSRALIVVDMEPPATAPVSLPHSSEPSVAFDIILGKSSEALTVAHVELPDQRKALAVVESFASAPAGAIDVPLSLEMTPEVASEYISSVQQKIVDYLYSTDVDSQKFAGMLVSASRRSLSVLANRSPTHEQRKAVADESSMVQLNKKIFGRLKKLLLKSTKKLLAKHKDCLESSPATTISANVDENIKESELQILFRLEMISLDKGKLLEETAKDQLVEDICKLLDSIQFHLDGGLFSGKGLLEYCNRLLVNRYKQSLPSTIAKIYNIMELDGYSDLTPNSAPYNLEGTVSNLLSSTGELSCGGSHDGVSQPENRSGNVHGHIPCSQGGTDDAALQAVVGKSKRTLSFHDSEKSHELDKTQKKGSYHFASGGSNLMRLRKFKPRLKKSTTGQLKSLKVHGKSKVLANDSAVQVVYQTPVRAAYTLWSNDH